MTLEDRIREAAANRRFDGFTVWLTTDGKAFQAGVRPPGPGNGFRVHTNPDPVTALHGALDQVMPRPKAGVFD